MPMDPLLSIVLVTPTTFAYLRRAVRHLRAQTIAAQIELILVATDASSLNDARPEELTGFFRVIPLGVGPIPGLDIVAAQGFNQASAPILAYTEDHAYPHPTWAASIVAFYRDHPHFIAVGSQLFNANPATSWSWANLILSFGWWAEGNSTAECHALPGHNITFRRDFLYAAGPLQGNELRRESGFFEQLQSRGGRLALCAEAQIEHMNGASLHATWHVRYHTGRNYASRRSQRFSWSLARRLLYVAGSPLIPFLRFHRLRQELAPVFARAGLRSQPAIFIGLVCDAIGQAMGFAFGPGDALPVLEIYETQVRTYVLPQEAALMDS